MKDWAWLASLSDWEILVLVDWRKSFRSSQRRRQGDKHEEAGLSGFAASGVRGGRHRQVRRSARQIPGPAPVRNQRGGAGLVPEEQQAVLA